MLATWLFLAACTPVERFPDLQRHLSFEHDGLTRDYHFQESDEAGDRPLIVVLHGGGATIDAFIGGTLGGATPLAGIWLEIAQQEGLHVAIPQGVDRQWNDCRADCDHCGDADDSGFLMALVDHLSETVAVDQDRVHFAGESNGGFMTQRMAAEHGDRLAALGVVIAAEPADSACAPATTAVPMAYVVGTDDDYIPYGGGQSRGKGSGTVLSSDDTVANRMALNGCSGDPQSTALADRDETDGSTVTRESWTCEATGAGVVRYRVDGGGHVVPSIEEPVSRAWESLAGEQNHDMETVRELWTFFDAHPRG